MRIPTAWSVEPERRQRLKGKLKAGGPGALQRGRRERPWCPLHWRGLGMATATLLGNKIDRDKPKSLSKAELPQPKSFSFLNHSFTKI